MLIQGLELQTPGQGRFAGEPLVEVTAPIAEAQLAETVLLNHIAFQTGIATKAARCALAARGAQLVDFSFGSTTPACRTPGSSPAAVSTSTPSPPCRR